MSVVFTLSSRKPRQERGCPGGPQSAGDGGHVQQSTSPAQLQDSHDSVSAKVLMRETGGNVCTGAVPEARNHRGLPGAELGPGEDGGGGRYRWGRRHRTRPRRGTKSTGDNACHHLGATL